MGTPAEFLLEAFAGRSQAPVCILCLPNIRGAFSPSEIYTRDLAEAEAFVKERDGPGAAIYFGANTTLPGRKRNKDNVAEIVTLHADLDFKTIAASPDIIDQVLRALPLPPSTIVDSGNGFHGYWRFREALPPELRERVEAALKRLAWALAGDPAVCEIARIMRLPGSHNTKDGAWKPVLVRWNSGREYSFEELEDWLSGLESPLLARLAPPPKAGKNGNGHDGGGGGGGLAGDGDPFAAFGAEVKPIPIDVEDELDAMEFGGTDGNGVNLTQLRVIGSLLHEGVGVEQAIDYVVDATWARIPEALAWDRAAEVRQLRDMTVRTIKGRPELLELQEGGVPKWLSQQLGRIEAGPDLKAIFDAATGARPSPKAEPQPQNAPPKPGKTQPVVIPVNLWDEYPPAPLPRKLLPPVIEEYAFAHGKLMGCDPAGMAMAALTVCATIIPDGIQLHVMRHGNYRQSARLWTALIGGVSVMKSPIITEATRQLREIDLNLARAYASELAAYRNLPPDERRAAEVPKHLRVRIEDATTEAAAEIIRDSPEGVLLSRDELSGWFGSLGKYAGGNRGAAADRSFWLTSYNGGYYSYDRIKRGSHVIENLSVNLLGGIQPTRIQEVADEGTDDGLIQRMIPVLLQPSVLAHDAPLSKEAQQYDQLIDSLNATRLGMAELRFSEAAQEIQYARAREHIKLRDTFAGLDSKLAEHFGKYDGMFARLCVTWHCIENHDKRLLPAEISAETASRVAKFMHEFMLPHAIGFYINVLGLSDNSQQLLAIASYILVHQPKNVTRRDIQRSSSSMKGLDRGETERIFHQLETLGWVTRIGPRRAGDPPSWDVNPVVYEMFKERAKVEAYRKKEAHAMLLELFSHAKKEHKKNGS
jgi:hypothetical protein